MSSFRQRAAAFRSHLLLARLRSVLKEALRLSETALPADPHQLGAPQARGAHARTQGSPVPETPASSPCKRTRPAKEGNMRLRFVRLSEHATTPTRGSARAAGYDLYSAYDYTIPPMEKALVKTDIQIALPSGCYGRVASSLIKTSNKHNWKLLWRLYSCFLRLNTLAEEVGLNALEKLKIKLHVLAWLQNTSLM
ncbi:PREDICTED: deoxyuridine 5'-triphosphate nucleotidohydrolase, mitochondrial isoform X2 [Dipodomys ordii]|uniref:dUTP diphosphatase n=1 Tax=Dipodomys ordii TaxID=10020 RepID=A0A1S3EP79_DIPOR|nr:PREDICTED: deoxyuridine 5'-triphosphate nucleotidohydrolase, mitochondrial isoform X2 [Dipodomys ordii]